MKSHEGAPDLKRLPKPKARGKRHELAADVSPRSVVPRAVPKKAPLDHHSLYFNNELGWLDFNWRVLHQARDARVPLLERARFLSITSLNLDEFYQKRVGGLKRQKAAGVTMLSYDGRTPGDQLRLVKRAALEMHSMIERSVSAAGP